MKKNKTVPELEGELENVVPISYLGPDGIQRRLRHPTKSTLLERISQSNDPISFIKEKILEIDSYTTEYNSRDFDDDLRDYYLRLVKILAEEYSCSKASAYEYLKGIVDHSIEQSTLNTIAGKMKSILQSTLDLFDYKLNKTVLIQGKEHHLGLMVLIQTEDYNQDACDWSLNDLRIRFQRRS